MTRERLDDRENCTTVGSFSEYGIDDGVDLVTRTYDRLRPATREFDPTETFYDRLESAFVWAYLAAADDPTVPPAVRAAVDDALARTREEFRDRPDADLRTAVVPAFYRRVAAYHCRYRTAAPGVAVGADGDGTGG